MALGSPGFHKEGKQVRKVGMSKEEQMGKSRQVERMRLAKAWAARKAIQ